MTTLPALRPRCRSPDARFDTPGVGGN